MPGTPEKPRILDDIRVVELTDFVAGPFAGRILSDFGADVIKIEPPRGDSARRRGPFAHAVPHRETSALFLHYNTNKRGLRLDIGTRAGLRLLNTLLDDADVFLSDLEPSELERYGLTTVREGRPSLIVASITPHGLHGPAVDLPSTPYTRMHGAGTAHVLVRGLGADLGKPLPTGAYVNEADGGTACAIATLAALIARGPDRGVGDGQVAEVSVLEAMSSLDRVELSISRNDGPGRPMGRRGLFGGRLECKDGYIICAMPQPHQWAGMVHAMGDPDWALDDDGNPIQRGDENAEMLFKNLSAWCAEHTREEIYRSAQARSAPVGPIYSPSEVMASEQEAARGFFRPLDHEVAGTLQYTTTSALYSQAAPPPNAAAPLLGEANHRLIAPALGDGWSAATARRAGVA